MNMKTKQQRPQYEFAPGIRMPKEIDPDDAGRSVEKLIRKHGEARPEDLVRAARDSAHPLNTFFQWDNAKAAHEHRLEQARYVLRAIVVVPAAEARPVRAFVNVERAGGWKPIEMVLANPTTRDLLLTQALAELRAFERKFNALTEIAGIRRETERLAAMIEQPRKRTRST